jgi:hypothetical protein
MPVYGLLLMGGVLPTRESSVMWLEVVILMAAAVWYLLLLEASPTALPPKLVVFPDLEKASSSLCFSPRCCHGGGQGADGRRGAEFYKRVSCSASVPVFLFLDPLLLPMGPELLVTAKS